MCVHTANSGIEVAHIINGVYEPQPFLPAVPNVNVVAEPVIVIANVYVQPSNRLVKFNVTAGQAKLNHCFVHSSASNQLSSAVFT